MKIRTVISIILLSVLSTLCYAKEKTVKIATLKGYAPFCMAEEKVDSNQIIPVGEDAVGFKGYSWDVLRSSLHKMGYTIHLSIVPWVRALDMVKTKESDVLFPTGWNSEREKIFLYSKESINDAYFLVYVRKENQLKWNGLESLNGLSIGFKRGYNYGDKWMTASGIRKVEINTILQGFKMLDAKRLDGFLGYEYNWDYVLKKSNWRTEYRKLPAFDSSSEYLVTRKGNKQGQQVLNAFDIGKKQLIKSGEIEKIRITWFGDQ